MMLIVLAMLLSGCTADIPSDVSLLEEQKNLVVSCLNDHDQERLQALLYPVAVSQIDMDAGFQSLMDVWQPVDAEDVKMLQFSSQRRTSLNQRITVFQGIYQLPKGMEQYALYLSFAETAGAKGLNEINIVPVSQVAVEKKPLSLTISRIVTVCFIIFSIIDVVRKKPRRYGWYIALCIVLFRINYKRVRYVVLPLGALIYWCIRKKLLAKKAAMLKTEEESKDQLEQNSDEF